MIVTLSGEGVSSLSSLTGTEQGIQAAEGGKALSWRAFCRKLIEIKSPLPICLGFALRSESFAYEPTVQHRSISSQSGFVRFAHTAPCRKSAFTLAEVLITLGIIGVVAAMTLPALVGNYRKKQVEVKLKRFYSVFNNALIRSEADNEQMQFWEWPENSYKDEDGEIIQTGSISDYEWFEKYLKPYFNIKDVNQSFHLYCVWYDGFAIKMTDGTGVACGIYEGRSFGDKTYPFVCMFFPESKNIDNVRDYNTKSQSLISGKDYFIFQLFNGINGKKGLQAIDSDKCTGEKGFKNLPSIGCVKKIIENNWEIPDDYPVKF